MLKYSLLFEVDNGLGYLTNCNSITINSITY